MTPAEKLRERAAILDIIADCWREYHRNPTNKQDFGSWLRDSADNERAEADRQERESQKPEQLFDCFYVFNGCATPQVCNEFGKCAARYRMHQAERTLNGLRASLPQGGEGGDDGGNSALNRTPIASAGEQVAPTSAESTLGPSVGSDSREPSPSPVPDAECAIAPEKHRVVPEAEFRALHRAAQDICEATVLREHHIRFLREAGMAFDRAAAPSAGLKAVSVAQVERWEQEITDLRAELAHRKEVEAAVNRIAGGTLTVKDAELRRLLGIEKAGQYALDNFVMMGGFALSPLRAALQPSPAPGGEKP